MPKFKVGDKVRLNPSKTRFQYGQAGVSFREVGTITHVVDAGGTGDYRVLFKSHGGGWTGLESEFIPYIESTQKPKEHKTMNTRDLPKCITKKPGTAHGKPTAKGMKSEKKPTAAKVSKYPAPREALGIMIPDYRNPKSKATKADLVDQVFDLLDTALDARKDLATTGTKLDRALVDLKEAKKRIKELEAAK